jgi:hypothetical protein
VETGSRLVGDAAQRVGEPGLLSPPLQNIILAAVRRLIVTAKYSFCSSRDTRHRNGTTRRTFADLPATQGRGESTARATKQAGRSGALNVGVHDLLVAGEVERDGEPVVLDLGDPAVAEFLVEDAVADGKTAGLANFFAAPRHRTRFD